MGEVHPGSLGRLVAGYDAKIIDQEGKECGPGEVGTLWVRGDSSAAFYWQRAEKSREVLQGGWVVSSDQFMRDAEGQFYYRGRADDLLKVGGRWLAPQEIEDALTKHPAVAEAGASAFAQEGLTKPMAFVILRAGFEPTPELAKALSQHVADTTLPFKAPRFIEFVTELPRSDRDKLARGALEKLAGEAAVRRGLGVEG
jgi:benzoate-CoA ligase